MTFLRIVVICMCLFVQSISLVEISCDRISGTQTGRKYCFVRKTAIGQNDTVTIKADDYAENRRELIFDNCTFHSLPGGLFEHFPNLHTVYTWNTGIRYIPWEAFKNGGYLKAVDLSQNNITELQDNGLGTFSLAPNLNRLDISNNQIKSIIKTAFLGLSHLTHLYLENNKIESIFVETFDPLVKLSKLRLNKNKIKRIEPNLFIKNLDLSFIHLEDNEIEFMDGKGTFKHLSKVNVFDCHNNPIRDLDRVIINAVSIDVRKTRSRSCYIGNRTKKLIASDNGIDHVIVDGGANVLQHLDLSNNDLPKMANLTQFVELLSLDLSGNRITDIGINSFAGMHKLESLRLQNCGLGLIQYGLFSHKSKLKELDISFNGLGHLDFNMFMSLANLKALYLEGNDITDMDMSAIRKIFPALTKIGISQNKWKCYNLALIIKFLESEGIELNSIGLTKNSENIKGIPCSSVEVGQTPVHKARDQQVFEEDGAKSGEIQKIRANCRYSIKDLNEVELMVKLTELKYDAVASFETIRMLKEKIETILDSLHSSRSQTHSEI